MKTQRILYFILAIAFLLLNLSVVVTAVMGRVDLTFPLLGASFAIGVILYFLMRFHKKEKEYRKESQGNGISHK